VRLEIKPTTIKKLFSLSGNICAFPDCTQKLVDKSDRIIGVVCHIEAAEKRGQRYNPKQTDEERRSFNNLIIFCPTHHRVTDDESIYTTERLKEMKVEHERKFYNNKFKIKESLIEKIVNIVNNQKYTVTNGDLYAPNQGDINIYNGITESQTVAIVEDTFNKLFELNYPKLLSKSQKLAEKNRDDFLKEFKLEFFKNSNLKYVENFADPGIEFLITESVVVASGKDNKLLHKNLAKILAECIKNVDDDFQNTTLSYAISVIPKLSLNQLKILSLMSMIFINPKLLGYKEYPLKDLENYFSKYLIPFQDFLPNDLEISHLVSLGCISRGLKWNIDFSAFKTIIFKRFSPLFRKYISEKEFESISLPVLIKNKFFTFDKNNQCYYWNEPNKNKYESFISKNFEFPTYISSHIIEKCSKYFMSDSEIYRVIDKALGDNNKLVSDWDSINKNHEHELLPLGFLIGLVNCNSTLNLSIPIEKIFIR